MSKKLLAVFGATGNQGGSVIRHVLADPVLSSSYAIRAITRDTASARAAALVSGGGVAELVAADLSDPATIPAAIAGAHTVFLISATPSYTGDIRAQERDSAVAAANACVATGVQRVIYSTLPHISAISGGKYKSVGSFDGKAEAELHIRDLSARGLLAGSSFISVGSFMQNWHTVMKPRASPAGDGSYVVRRHVRPETRLPLIDITDTGKWVAAMLAEPDRFEGKTVCAASRTYSMLEIAEALGKSTGKKVVYQQVSVEEGLKGFGGDRTPVAGMLVEMMLYQQDFGYYGAETEKEVAWGVENAKGHVTTFEEFLEREPLRLE
ncbi:HSCARG dehydrogenase [Microdochium bolleyi]|uniref:HSCARG dehydrogenase n=1 Tax=Microdochium bolleyi TaxID=196109 RepID=A0A136IQ47_9PEZI|nr:HSCARG dehydrogenase [Microdochium bolleyi]